MRRGAAVLAGYLILTTGPLLAAGSASVGSGVVWGVVVACHLALLVWTILCFRDRVGTGRKWLVVLADWTPLLVIPALYAELPLLMEGMPGSLRYFDLLVARFDETLFATRPAFTLAGALPSTALSELLHLAYFLYYPLIYVPPLLLYLGVTGPGSEGDGGGGNRPPARTAFHATVTGLALSMTACYLVFVVFPVQGPRYLDVPPGVPDGRVRALVLLVLESGSSRGAAFPSSHVAVAVTQTVLALRWHPRVGAVVAVVTLGLAVGAVYGGFHYATDVLAGVPVGLAAALVAVCWGGRNSPRRAGFTSSRAAV